MANRTTTNDPDSILKQQFGFLKFRPGQRDALNNILAGEDTLAVMPTGYGKSLIYQLAALMLPNITLVISPLISLMKDQVDSLSRYKISASYINSSIGSLEQANRLRNLTEGGYKIILVAPERLRNRAFNNALSKVPISLLVVDEAHCLSQWGHDFRPDYLQITEFSHQHEDPIILALTATATLRVQKEIIRLLDREDMKKVVTGFNRPNLKFEVSYTPHITDKLRFLHQYISQVEGTGIIYTGTRRDAEEVSEFITRVIGLPARYYHAGLDQQTRNNVQDSFMSGALELVAATNAFGMGIDRPDVRFVIHYSLPGSLEAYYQEAGRAGRDGKPAQAILLYSPDDTALQEFFINNDSPTMAELCLVHEYVSNLPAPSVESEKGIRRFRLDDLIFATSLQEVKARVAIDQIEIAGGFSRHQDEAGNLICVRVQDLSTQELRRTYSAIETHRRYKRAILQKMVKYAETNECRRRTILEYFGDNSTIEIPECCDNCLSHHDIDKDDMVSELTGNELIILDTIFKIRWGLGKRKLVQILKGSSAKAVARYKNHPNYGVFQDYRRAKVETNIEGLIDRGCLKSVGYPYPTLSLTSKGKEIHSKAETLQINKLSSRIDGQEQTESPDISNTIKITKQFLLKGLTPEDVAKKRQLTLHTIYSHISNLIGGGEIHIDSIIPITKQQIIRAAIDEVGSTKHLSPIMALLPDRIDYNLINCVISAWNYELSKATNNSFEDKSRNQDRAAHIHSLGVLGSVENVPELINALKDRNGNVRRLAASALGKLKSCDAVEPLLTLLDVETKPQVRQYSIKALGKIGDQRAIHRLEEIANDSTEKDYNRNSAQTALRLIKQAKREPSGNTFSRFNPINPSPIDDAEITTEEVSDFLRQPRPRPLEGPWLRGWALDYHSRFVGTNQIRSKLGKLVYNYKYQGEYHFAVELVQLWVDLLDQHPELPKPDVVIPIPPSIKREFDPVTELAKALSSILDIPAMINALSKTRITKPQKELNSLVAKQRNISGAFHLNKDVKRRNILLIDDLYDSGATLCEAARTLARGYPASIVVLTLTKTIHSNP